MQTQREGRPWRDHTWPLCAFYVASLALCITTDILQYSMPLAFLPSVLEDRGHSMLKITAAVGVYYWTGFLGCFLITCLQVYRVVKGPDAEQQDEANPTVQMQKAQKGVIILLLALGIGTVTLMCQATWPTFNAHLSCRFVQGFAGAIVFFYVFLLSAQLFRGAQQVFAMTSVSCALNVAEVLGSVAGAMIHDRGGSRAVFWILAAFSVLTQVMLAIMFLSLRYNSPALADASETKLSPSNLEDASGADAGAGCPSFLREAPPPPAEDLRAGSGVQRIRQLLSGRRLCVSVVLIFTAAMVKGTVEEALPFHADHEWGFSPVRIGKMFFVIAVAYISAAICAGRLWGTLGSFQVAHSSVWLAILGGACWGLFSLAYLGYGERWLTAMLCLYGFCLGMTHTPAALMVAEAIEAERDSAAKDAVNGIWNTVWEAGGSLGFLGGGLLASTYSSMVRLMMGLCFLCFSMAVVCMGINMRNMPVSKLKMEPPVAKTEAQGYGSVAA